MVICDLQSTSSEYRERALLSLVADSIVTEIPPLTTSLKDHSLYRRIQGNIQFSKGSYILESTPFHPNKN